jgi:hypothetical protein
MKNTSKVVMNNLFTFWKSKHFINQQSHFKVTSYIKNLYHDFTFSIFKSYFRFLIKSKSISDSINTFKKELIYEYNVITKKSDIKVDNIMNITTFKRKKLKLKKHKTRKRERRIKNINKKNL